MSTTGDLERAMRSLEGLSVGDAYGEQFFFIFPDRAGSYALPGGIWLWTDDTHMALSIVEVLKRYDRIDQDALARTFAKRFQEEPLRGYGRGTVRLLTRIADGGNWRTLSTELFGGGSYGNGSAMRVAPVGGYFHSDLQRAAEEARLSAVVTHAHPEGQAGAVAVAVAAAIAAQRPFPTGNDFLREVEKFVPDRGTLHRLRSAHDIPCDDLPSAIEKLGTGAKVSAQDTVPFCLWCAAHHLDNFEEAVRWTAGGRGDSDTTCAIVGGITALSSNTIPSQWLKQREPLPPI
jgi:ADP-ribosylglycohydrolase